MAEVDGFGVVPHANWRAGRSHLLTSAARRRLTFRRSSIVPCSASSRQNLFVGRRAVNLPGVVDAAIAWRSNPSSFGARQS